MSRPMLLIVDGESIRTPSLGSTLEGDGWDVQWLGSGEARAFLGRGLVPELLMLDPVPGSSGYAMAEALRRRKPGLPVLVLSEASAAGSTPMGQPLEVQAFLARTLSPADFTEALRKFRTEAPKLTSDDIFGDLLADLEGVEAPAAASAPVVAFNGVPRAALPAATPASRAPMSAEDIFGPVLEEVESLAQAEPERGHLPIPSVKVDAIRVPGPQASELLPAEPPAPEAQAERPVEVAEPLGPSDFTLSGISGVNDPFEWAAANPPAPREAAASPAPAPKAEVPGAPQVLEEYGNYFLLEKIAVGGMAELFKAQQRGVQGFQKIVAIKRILPHFSDNEDFVTMFIDEAKLAAQLTHPNIVQIFDLGKAGSSYYIAMEYVNGRDLRTLLKKVREYGMPIPEQVAAFVVMKVAAALDYAHRKRGFDDRELKLVHRDISPQNVILSTEGAVKLVDFGIAKAASKASHTVAGALKGKLLYMSPEQATGQPLDNRSDLYSLGLVLFELLTGERCFQADSELGVLEKVRLGRISDLATLNPNVSKEIAAIVSRALQKGVDHRYPSARFMERDLREYLQRQGTPITEHDVAEYVNTLLKGSRQQLEALITAKFPPPTTLVSGTHRVLQGNAPSGHSGGTSTVTAAHHATMSRLETVAERPAPPSPDLPKPARPRWLLPVILAMAVILIIMLIVATWS
ncbi:MAG TPA: protein kinase [Geothrix sp.]|nr:protein kinase [Geothrix sp.]